MDRSSNPNRLAEPQLFEEERGPSQYELRSAAFQRMCARVQLARGAVTALALGAFLHVTTCDTTTNDDDDAVPEPVAEPANLAPDAQGPTPEKCWNDLNLATGERTFAPCPGEEADGGTDLSDYDYTHRMRHPGVGVGMFLPPMPEPPESEVTPEAFYPDLMVISSPGGHIVKH